MTKKYDGMKRVKGGQATVFRDPVQKGDEFEHENGLITKIFRDGDLLYKLKKRISIRPKGSYVRIVHLEVDANPGRMSQEEAIREGFAIPLLFKAAFEAAYGENALWRPAWRVEWERVEKIPVKMEAQVEIEIPVSQSVGTAIVGVA